MNSHVANRAAPAATANKSECPLSAPRDTSSVRSPSTVPSSSSASRRRRALALSDQTMSNQPKLTVSGERDSLDRTSLTHITRTRSFAINGKPDDPWLPGFTRAMSSPVHARDRRSLRIRQDVPQGSHRGIAKQIRGAPPGFAPASVLSVHSADFQIASRSLLRS